MAETLPVSIARRWTADLPRPAARSLLPSRSRLALVFGVLLLTCAGAAAGVFAWWRPLASPGVFVITTAPAGRVSAARSLAMERDGTALATALSPRPHIVIDDTAPTRLELQHCL